MLDELANSRFYEVTTDMQLSLIGALIGRLLNTRALNDYITDTWMDKVNAVEYVNIVDYTVE